MTLTLGKPQTPNGQRGFNVFCGFFSQELVQVVSEPRPETQTACCLGYHCEQSCHTYPNPYPAPSFPMTAPAETVGSPRDFKLSVELAHKAQKSRWLFKWTYMLPLLLVESLERSVLPSFFERYVGENARFSLTLL